MMVEAVCSVVAMSSYIGALRNNSCRNSEPRGIVVIIPLANPLTAVTTNILMTSTNVRVNII